MSNVFGRNTVFIFFLFALASFAFVSCARFRELPGDAGVLLEMKKNQDEQNEIIREETDRFQHAVDLIRRNELEYGLTLEEVEQKLGHPAVTASRHGGQEWIYRNSEEGWIGGPKVRLQFDANDQLIQWECIRVQCQTRVSTE